MMDAVAVPAVAPPNLGAARVAVIGLGYVGLPLALAFGAGRRVVGFDANPTRIETLRAGKDANCEVGPADFDAANQVVFSDDQTDLASCNVFIITVPTPIDAYKRPDLGPLLAASQTVGTNLEPGDVVIFESTVYPGATEEDCVPALERASGLVFNQDFLVGYSPERVNPGDGAHRLSNIVKVTSGSTPAAATFVDALYREIVHVGTHKAPSIRVAEAAKVIENTQRDLNIALVNELAIIFNHMGIDTGDVLSAAATKWNFLPFQPGLVGGHCIGVDPYYLTHKAEALGYHPEIVLAGRRLNDGMGRYVAGQFVKAMARCAIDIGQARTLVLGLTFKENCPDIRNTRVIDVIAELEDYGIAVDVCDPWADPSAALSEYGVRLTATPPAGTYDGILLAVGHDAFRDLGVERMRAYGRDPHVIYDLKSVLPNGQADVRL